MQGPHHVVHGSHPGGGREGGGRHKKQGAWDQEMMFSQLAKRCASQRFLERAGKFYAVISPASAVRVQCWVLILVRQ